MKQLSFAFAALYVSLAAGAISVGCSGSDGATPGDDDTGAIDTGGTTSDATSDTRTDVGSDTTTTDGTTTDTTPTDGTATDSTATDGAPTDTIATDTTATDTSTTDTGGTTDSSGACTVDAVTGKSTGCSSTQYCDAPSCTTGTCKTRPTATTDFAPACGCDGVTYWNSTYGKSLGTSMPSGLGACGTGKKTCGGIASIKCPSTTDRCVSDRSGTSAACGGADVGGQCWSIPSGASCSGVVGFTSYRVCSGGIGGGSCQTYCDALLSKKDFFNDSLCPI